MHAVSGNDIVENEITTLKGNDNSDDIVAPRLIMSAAIGAEDTPVWLDIRVDYDGNPSDLMFLIAGVPGNASLSQGFDAGGGVWELQSADLNGLLMSLPTSWSGTLNLQVTVVADDNGEISSSTAQMPVTITGIASPPIVSVQSAFGLENTAIALSITATLSDTDGSETLMIEISNLPVGASLSAGTDQGNGVWILTSSELNNLLLIPPLNFSGNLNLIVTATSFENGTSYPVSANLDVGIGGVASLPVLVTQDVLGLEDQVMALQIQASTSDPDGESLTIVIGNVPAGASLSAGHDNGNGTWDLTPSQLSGLLFVPPLNFSGQIDLSVTAISSENGSQAQVQSIIHVGIDGVPDTPNVSVNIPGLAENTSAPLTINASLNDTDGSETLFITISGLPSGSSLSAGTDNGNGSWTLSPVQLQGLIFTPPPYYSGIFNLVVSATASENGSSATNTLPPYAVSVTGVPSLPYLNVSNATGVEGAPVALSIVAALTDTDGSETLDIIISGLPVGAVLSAGQDNGNGAWTLNASQLLGLTLLPPANFSGDLHLSVEAVAHEVGSTISNAAILDVTVTPVAHAPIVTVIPSSGNEDSFISLNISVTPYSISESVSVVIGNVPAGGSLSAGVDNGDGTWTLSPPQLQGLIFTPPSDWNGTLNLSVNAISSLYGTNAVTTTSMPVVVFGTADVPVLSVLNTSGLEDTPIVLHISSALSHPSSSEVLSIVVGNIPVGASLSAGVDNQDGTWTLTPGQLSGLSFNPPPNFSGQINLSVTAISTDNGTSAQISSSISVAVTGVADSPYLNTSPVSGNEDTAINLNITAGLSDTDGSESLSITISGVPPGASLSAGTSQGGGTWILTSAQLPGLQILPPLNWSGSFVLNVSATSAEGSSISSVSGILPVTVGGVPDIPVINVSAAVGSEDSSIALNISASLSDGDGSESLIITIGNVPSGASLSAGVDNHDGTWTLTPAQLAGLTYTPPLNVSGSLTLIVTATSSENGSSANAQAVLPVTINPIADQPSLIVGNVTSSEDIPVSLNISASLLDTDGSETLTVIVSGVPANASLSAGINNGDGTWTLTSVQLSGLTLSPPSHWSGDIPLSITAIAGEGSSTSSISAGFTVHVEGVATAPILSVLPAIGLEDTLVPLNINAVLADTDGSEALSIVISGVPLNASLSAGVNNGNGVWVLTPGQLIGLGLIPPPHESGSITLNVEAISSENGTTASAGAVLPVSIAGAPTSPLLSVSSVIGAEDIPVLLSINAALSDTDGSESLEIIVGNIPAGASLSAGINNGNGTWTLTATDLAGLLFIPPAHWGGQVDLSITAVATENMSSVSAHLDLSVTITGVADIPLLNVHAVSGVEDTPVQLDISSSLADTDGSENLSLTIAGLPLGAALSSGINNGNGTWTVSAAQLPGISVIPPSNWSGSFILTVTATATEGLTSANAVAFLPVTIGGVADAPILNVVAASGLEDAAISLNISAALADTDGSETLTVVIGNVPAGAVLSAGINNHNGTWSLTPLQLPGLTYTPPLNASGLVNLSVTASAQENGTSVNTVATLPVTISGVADQANLIVLPALGLENTSVALNINASLFDTDGSETLSITISGVPAGASLSAGLNAGNGVWVLTPQQLSGLTLSPPANYNGAFALTVTALSSENSTTNTISSSLPVTVAGVASVPVLMVSAAAGTEDQAISVSISASLSDSSEVLSVIIGNVPVGATLSHGLYAGGGKWSLSPSDLSGLTITPPANYSGVLSLSVTAVSTENNGEASSLTLPLTVTISPTVDAPLVSVIPATGNEDTAISLNINANLADTDGSEILSVLISNVPLSAVLSAGINLGAGVWSLTSAQLANLKITPASNSDADFILNVAVRSTESNGSFSTVNTSIAVTVNGVADIPLATAANASSLSNQVNLVFGGSLADTDGSETISYIVHGVPDGFALNHGVNNGDNTWTLTAADLAGLQMTAPEQFNGQLNLNLTAVAHDSGGSVAVSAASSFYARFGDYSHGYLVDLGIGVNIGGIGVGVHVGALPDIDLLPAAGGLLGAAGIYAKEDTSFLIADAPNLLSSSLLSAVIGLLSKIQFSGVPAGVTFSAGTNLGGGVWQFTSAQLNNLYMHPASNSDTDFTILVSAKMLMGLADIALVSVPVHMMGVADIPNLTANVSLSNEDVSVPLNISGSLLDLDGSESLSFLVSGLPSGFMLNHGTGNANGTWSLQSSDLAGLAIIPKENFSGTVNLTVSSIATEREGDQAVRQQNISLNISAITDAPVISVNALQTNEDQPVGLNLSVGLQDTDGSESISAVTISGLPAGSSLIGATDNHNGTWSADPAHLNLVQFVPPSNWHGDVNLTINAVSRESSTGLTANTSTSLLIHVHPVADNPIAIATDSTGDMDQAIPLHVGASLVDADGSESLTVVISGMPNQALLSAGINNGDGSWTLSVSQLSGLEITPPESFVGDINLTLTAHSRDGANSTSSGHQDFSVHVMAPVMSMMMSMAFNLEEADPYANQNGWVDNASSAADASIVNSDPFSDSATSSPGGNDHDQAFHNHNTG